MAWISRDKNERLYIYWDCPKRISDAWINKYDKIELPSDADEKLIGKHIDWYDEPIGIWRK